MTPQDLLAPLSEEDSCGPDLYESFDSAFESYLLEAEERLPQSFFGADGNPRIAPDSIDPETEWERASALLARSRDLRVLASYAQFCALARAPVALADCLDLMAGLLEAFPDAVHPRVTEDIIDRNNALELLASRATVIMPLEFTPLVRDRRLLDISLRKILLGRGERSPQGEEEPGDAEAMVAALRAAENADAVTASHAALTRIKQAAGRIEAVCLTNEAQPFRPNLEELHTRVDELLALLAEARPELGGGAEDTGADTEAPDADMSGADADEAGGPEAAPAAPPGRIADMAQARAALDALEAYFRTREPSSPGLILVRQARQLVGRPLIEALEILVPEMSARARIDFGRESGFLLGMDRMRALSDIGGTEETAIDSTDFAVSSRKEAGALMSALEAYYSSNEPSSPIPVLLTRARGSLNQSFTAILAEFLPAQD